VIEYKKGKDNLVANALFRQADIELMIEMSRETLILQTQFLIMVTYVPSPFLSLLVSMN
jgi:hypothetical protein